MNQNLLVTKRDGSTERINFDKIYCVLDWAAEGLHNVLIFQVELRFYIQFYDGIKTFDIYETIIKAAADLIFCDALDYQYFAARLAIFYLRKKAYGQFELPALYDYVVKMVEMGKYDNYLLEDYTEEEFKQMDTFIDYDCDMTFFYAAVKQLEGKYLVQNCVTGEIYESAQFFYILVAACLFLNYLRETRLQYVKRFYDAVFTFKILLLTLIMFGVRTLTRQFSSCVLIECGDSLDFINATFSAIVKYVFQRAGIGINAGRICALGSPICGGEAFYTGCILFYKHFQTAVKFCFQGGVRGGAATLFYLMWHLEVESLLVLKNNCGVEGNCVRYMDYGVQINKLMYTCLLKGEDITLFSLFDVLGLYDAFFADQEEFERLYTKYEKDDSICKQRVKAVELFLLMMQERAFTGCIYIQNVDYCNTYSLFDLAIALVRQFNLCLEIALPTKLLNDVNDENGEIALCTLFAFNLGAINNLDELEELAILAVCALDALLDYQDYLILAAKRGAMGCCTLGIGVINFAYYLAKHGKRYFDGSANNLTHKTFEAIQYYLLKAFNELAKEQGACLWFNETTYAKGILLIDTYKKDLDTIANELLHYDWEALRELIKTHGLRNFTLFALMLFETFLQIFNATNGIEPPRGYVSIKALKDGILRQVVPDYEHLHDAYELLWEMLGNDGYLQLVGIMQKFIDQLIFANTNYDLLRFPLGKVLMQQLLKDLLTAYKFGVKTLYYQNTCDGAEDAQDDLVLLIQDDGCESGACKI